MMLQDIFILVLSYLLGSLSGSLLLGHLRGVDIRQLGSGNAGGTNALRTQGFTFALGVVFIDIGKGALAAFLALQFASLTYANTIAFFAVIAAIIGHVWPIFHGFRGGKGAATLVGGLLVIWPSAMLVLIAVWCLCLSLGGYVGLSTVIAGFSLLAFALLTKAAMPVLVFSVVAAFLILFTHRSNLQRLMQKKESRFEKAMLWRRLWRALRGSDA
jgi:acyl phosphate:glycerol-3-phosphate acyltransferase